ncbi:MAG: FHIPEP family type III secretion protein, partial [Acidobacteria bacterium]|nr:FHIPEP family type III secretion protein [Acidobacteriota bacterium]
LDALPGKQMSIDADLNGGLIDDVEARRRRQELAREAEFYGAMDGASRFTQRDAVASILITAINIIAGFLIGVFQHGMEFQRALETYTVLTIGDGLVTVIPALMISVSGGLIVTRGNGDDRVGAAFQKQIFGSAEPLLLSSGVLVVMAAFPGLPAIPFLLLGGALGGCAWKMRRKTSAAAVVSAAAKSVRPAREGLETLLKVEPLTVELGLGLVGLADGGPASPLLEKLAGIRRQLAGQTGFIFPPVKVNDNMALRSREYSILLRGVEIARYELPEGQELAIPTAQNPPLANATRTQDPAFGLPAYWVPSRRADEARDAGYTVVDSLTVMSTHLSSVLRRHAHELFTRQETKLLCDRVALLNPKAVEDLVPKLLSLSMVQKVIQNLLRESVSIRDGEAVLEALGEAAAMTKNPVLLTEYVRQAIRRSLVQPYLDRNNELTAYFVGPAIEKAIEGAVEHQEAHSNFAIVPQQAREVVTRLTQKLENPLSPLVAVASSGCRYHLRQLVESSLAEFTVLSHGEIPAGVRVRSLGTLE